ncbi:MAG: hypothetical protein ACRENE_23110, partial [Polyangiaceae bacterium]
MMMRTPLDVSALPTGDLRGLRHEQLGEHDHSHLLHERQQTLLRRVHCQQQRQHQLLHRHAHRDRILFLLLSLDCGSLLHGGSFAPWGSSSGRPDSQASEEPPLLHEFNKLWDIP